MTKRDVYQLAQERLKVLDQERRELEIFLEKFDQFSAELEAEPTAEEIAELNGYHAATTDEIVATAMRVLATMNEPVRLAPLFDLVVAEGIFIGGSNPRANFGAKLSADHRLKSIKGKGWWFADESIPVTALWDAGDPIPTKNESYPQSSEAFQYDEGPAVITEGPSQMNGATELHTIATGTGV